MPITARSKPTGTAADLASVLGATLVVVVAAAVGRVLLAAGIDIFLPFPPLLAEWLPHVGPGTPVAAVVAVLVAAHGPGLADRLAWRPLLAVGYAASFAWTVALALVDGWQRGVVERLTSSQEYLHDVPRVTDISAMLRTFTDHILTDQPGFWTTHVGAHPPGALLTFVWLDRLGLGGGGPAGLFVMLVGASAPIAVAVAARALGAAEVARRALPFGVLLPGAVWVGVSADGMLAGVLAWGVALLAIGCAGIGARAHLAALAGGMLLGWCLYLSYGLALGGLLALAVLAHTRNLRAGVLAAIGTVAVVGAFTASGFWWFTGFERVQVIYAASIAAGRLYAYFVWANLAAVLFALGPAVVAAMRRAAALPTGVALVVWAGLAAILLADVSGMSKGEVERIWLPFAVWLVIPCALLPRARYWLAAQAGLALAVNHLLLTVW